MSPTEDESQTGGSAGCIGQAENGRAGLLGSWLHMAPAQRLTCGVTERGAAVSRNG